MSVLSKNDCGITTILPLGVECSVVNATTPESSDGRIYLNITGGSAPYSISWSNGKKSQSIRKLPVGSYSATVVDFYGDYTANTVCDVSSEQFYVDYFVDCDNEYNLYLTGFTGSATKGLVYKMINNPNCYTYSGKTLNGTNILTSDSIFSGPFETCLECDPPFTPPYFPNILCLSTQNPYTTYEFEFYGFVNNKPAYTGTSTNSLDYRIEWYTGSSFSYWVVQGLTQLKNTSDTYNPLGGWKKDGTTENWVAKEGVCPNTEELDFTYTVNDETCEGSCDGSITITAKGGAGGYKYSLDGTYFGPQPTFKNLCPTTNSYVYVTDDAINVANKTFTIKPGPKRTQYTLSLKTTQYYTTQNWGTQTIKKLDYVVVVTPPLPEGVTIDVPLIVSVNTTMLEPGSATTVYTPFLYSGTTAVSPVSNTLINTVITQAPIYTYRYPYNTIQKNHSVTYPTLKLKKDLVISGSVISTITKISDGLSNCCQPLEIENIGTNTHTYNWVNCTGGTQNAFKVFEGEKVNICACSAQATIGSVNSIVIRPGSLPCSSAKLDANLSASVGFNGASINNGCVSLVVLTPPEGQLYSQLYQPSNSGPAQ